MCTVVQLCVELGKRLDMSFLIIGLHKKIDPNISLSKTFLFDCSLLI